MSREGRLLNPKCVAISAVGIALYYTYPTRDSPNHLVWAAILSVGIYVGIAWYDTVYDCEDKNYAGGVLTALFRPLKPPIGADGRYGSAYDETLA